MKISSRFLLFLGIPSLLACTGLLPKSAPTPNPAVANLNTALDQLDAALIQVEAADPATLSAERLQAAQARLQNINAILGPVVQQSIGSNVTVPAPVVPAAAVPAAIPAETPPTAPPAETPAPAATP